jgi:hypothetical protein
MAAIVIVGVVLQRHYQLPNEFTNELHHELANG